MLLLWSLALILFGTHSQISHGFLRFNSVLQRDREALGKMESGAMDDAPNILVIGAEGTGKSSLIR